MTSAAPVYDHGARTLLRRICFLLPGISGQSGGFHVDIREALLGMKYDKYVVASLASFRSFADSTLLVVYLDKHQFKRERWR